MTKAAVKTATKAPKKEAKVAAAGVSIAPSAIKTESQEPSNPAADPVLPDGVVIVNGSDIEPLNRLFRLEQAQNLPELADDQKEHAKPAHKSHSAIHAFHDKDGRVMSVVMVDGALHKQEI